ncbi:hypothetical protein PROFUN_02052 [Planoprotostelium fungivorum]|uniref:Ubiquitin fusion degradation protein n=1 Tax=Planoprotostelium fungivorum TaxID=1890364 RepID=A0A2P6NB94_9EUKA|nr:hypothetical protein PROFUN_02052 [Planoprotostelium fungivorum]
MDASSISQNRIGRLCEEILGITATSSKLQKVASVKLEEVISLLKSYHSEGARKKSSKPKVQAETRTTVLSVPPPIRKLQSPRTRLMPLPPASLVDEDTLQLMERMQRMHSRPSSAYSFRETLRCYSFGNEDILQKDLGGNINLPPSCLAQMRNMEAYGSQSMHSMMVFELRNHNMDVSREWTHAGAMEFTAEEGTCIIPKWMMTKLGLNGGSMTNLRCVNVTDSSQLSRPSSASSVSSVSFASATIAKGTSLTLAPTSDTFFQYVPDPKETLEKLLRNFTVLTEGDTVMLPLNTDSEGRVLHHLDLIVKSVSPASRRRSIVVIDTDVELMIEPPKIQKTISPPPPASIVPTISPPASIVQREEESEDSSEDISSYSPFSGRGYSLGGTAAPPEDKRPTMSADPPSSSIKRDSDEPNVKGYIPFSGKGYRLG